MKIDHISKTDYYLSQNYQTCPISSTSDNYRFFYSNEDTTGNAVAIIIKTKDEPKYITLSNFILDSEEYKAIYGDKELLNKIGDFLGIEEEKKVEEDDLDKVVKIFQVIKDIVTDLDELELGLKGGKLLVSILTYQYDKTVEKFEKYVKEQIEILDEDNYDLFYDYLGDNFYS